MTDEQTVSRCAVCEKPLRRCCYMCPDEAHDDYCEGVPGVDEQEVAGFLAAIGKPPTFTAHDDRARDEQPAPEVRLAPDGSLWRRLDTKWARLMASGAQHAAAPKGSTPLAPAQPAPDSRETAADEIEPGSYSDLLNARVRFWVCERHDRGGVEWRGEVAHCLEDGCGRTSEQPAPAAADELAEAVLDVVKVHGGTEDIADAERFLAEYDEIGRERDAARAEVERLHEAYRVEELALLRAELERLRVLDEATRRQMADVLEQNQRLRARHAELERRDTAAAAVDAWSTMNEADRIFVRRYAPPLAAVLDELVRVRREGER